MSKSSKQLKTPSSLATGAHLFAQRLGTYPIDPTLNRDYVDVQIVYIRVHPGTQYRGLEHKHLVGIYEGKYVCFICDVPSSLVDIDRCNESEKARAQKLLDQDLQKIVSKYSKCPYCKLVGCTGCASF